MILFYDVKVNGEIHSQRIIVGEKASYKYLGYIEFKAKEDFKHFHNLTIRSTMNNLRISFVNNNYEFIEHIYELKVL